MGTEPQHVQEAREIIRAWELRDGHDAYVYCLDGGYRGYQAACWDCDWLGPERLHGPDEVMGTEESRSHKRQARADANRHREETTPAVQGVAGEVGKGD